MGILDNFPHLATAKIRVRTKDSRGGSKDSFTTVFTNRACWRQSAANREIREFEKRGMRVSHKIYFNADPGLDERHTLTIGSQIMEVRSAAGPDASAGLGRVWKVMADLTTTGSTP